jgi:anti-sigma B factor antagonist
MQIDYQDGADNLRRISLNGRLDIEGSEAIALKFTALTATAARRVVVDLTGVTFLASIGIRSLISNAKALQQRGGRMVLLVGGNVAVAKSLDATGIGAVIPLFADAAEAERAALA